jgi:hypothetical protein
MIFYTSWPELMEVIDHNEENAHVFNACSRHTKNCDAGTSIDVTA